MGVGALKLTHAIAIDGAEKIQDLVVAGRDAGRRCSTSSHLSDTFRPPTC